MRPWIPLALTVMAASLPALAANEAERAGSAPRHVESCVSRDAMHVGVADNFAMLDEEDRATLYDAMIAQYPMFARDGVQPTHIALWEPRERPAVYVTMIENPERAGELCFTATFAAERFPQTLQLRHTFAAP